jgi:hypothetical protein
MLVYLNSREAPLGLIFTNAAKLGACKAPRSWGLVWAGAQSWAGGREPRRAAALQYAPAAAAAPLRYSRERPRLPRRASAPRLCAAASASREAQWSRGALWEPKRVSRVSLALRRAYAPRLARLARAQGLRAAAVAISREGSYGRCYSAGGAAPSILARWEGWKAITARPKGRRQRFSGVGAQDWAGCCRVGLQLSGCWVGCCRVFRGGMILQKTLMTFGPGLFKYRPVAAWGDR